MTSSGSRPRATPARPDRPAPVPASLQALALACVIAAAVAIPFGLRAIGRFAPSPTLPESYVPALEARRAREMPFDTNVIADLRTLQPEFVLIGDSMVGSRIDATHLTVLMNYRTVAPIYYAATGSAFWYLALKNWVVASQTRPRLVVFFFRDENLTDPMFRVAGGYRATLDRVAHDREPVLNDILAMHTEGGWYRVHETVASLYRCDEVRAWLEPRLSSTAVALAVRPRSRASLHERVNREVFGLDALRRMNAADMAHAGDDEAFDFARSLPRSVLPAMFNAADRGGLKLGFVRVQRRPEPGGPPLQSPALRRYVGDLRRYIESRGGLFADDWGDPDQPLSIYADGDHVSSDFRQRYTELFLRKHPEFFRMIFHSLEFAVFFAVTITLYWSLTHRAQNVLLFVASYVFYGWVHPWFLALIATTTVVDYASARAIERWPARKRVSLALSLAIDFGLLGSFKYFNFFVENIAAAVALAGWTIPMPLLRVALPVGISFYTFQSVSYTIDVYRGHLPARKNLVDMAVFVSFFPHLVAGPIMRASHLLPQIERDRRFSAGDARDATVLLAWGFFKKLVIADNVGIVANKVFALESPEFAVLWAGVFAFAIQIYADFSAYTDIARGTARWLGFDLVRNFDHPYLAVGPADFWRRWNISLTTWFRDYVFLPLSFALSRRIDGGRWLGVRDDVWIYAIATMATFLLSGLWHGASWNFVLWGGYHGTLLVLARAASPRRRRRRRGRAWLRPFRIAGMFVLTCVGWLLFRETDLAALARDLTLSPVAGTVIGRQAGAYMFVLTLLYSLPLWIQSAWIDRGRADLAPSLSAAPGPHRSGPSLALVASQACLCGLLCAVILVFRSRTSLDFIYFQF